MKTIRSSTAIPLLLINLVSISPSWGSDNDPRVQIAWSPVLPYVYKIPSNGKVVSHETTLQAVTIGPAQDPSPAFQDLENAKVYLEKNKIDSIVPWIADKLETHRIVGIGGSHASAEPGKYYQAAVRAFFLKNPKKKILMAIEIPAKFQSDIDCYLVKRSPNEKFLDDIPHVYQGLVRFGRKIRQEGYDVDLVAFDTRQLITTRTEGHGTSKKTIQVFLVSWQGLLGQDDRLAQKVALSLRANPNASVLVLGGSAHLTYRENIVEEGRSPSMMYVLRQMFPKQTYTINVLDSGLNKKSLNTTASPQNWLDKASAKAGLQKPFALEIKGSPFEWSTENYRKMDTPNKWGWTDVILPLGSTVDGIIRSSS